MSGMKPTTDITNHAPMLFPAGPASLDDCPCPVTVPAPVTVVTVTAINPDLKSANLALVLAVWFPVAEMVPVNTSAVLTNLLYVRDIVYSFPPAERLGRGMFCG